MSKAVRARVALRTVLSILLCSQVSFALADSPISYTGTNGLPVQVTPSNPLPTSASGGGGGTSITPTSTTTTATSLVLKASSGTLYGGALLASTSGYLLIFNAASLPSNGAVTPVKCYAVTAGQSFPFSADPGTNWTFSTGIVLAFSSTGCFTLTATTALFITGQFQ